VDRIAANIAAVVDAIGVEAPGVVMGIALTPWDSADHLAGFLDFLTSK
jgi:hypothetical protein